MVVVQDALKSHGEARRQTKIAPLEVGRTGLKHIYLVAPTQPPHQSKIDSQAKVFGKRRFRG
jgi:hypothetical protein